MFDLNKSIAAWRRRYEHDRAFLPEDVRELEQHVRDGVEALVAEGVSEEEAFLRVLREMGEHEEVRGAYRGVRWGKLQRQRGLGHELISSMAMLKNYIKTALRNMRRQKGYAFINVAGLSIGLACSFFILLWVRHELSYDRFHKDGDRLYQVMRHGYLDNIYTWGSVPKPLADALERGYPEVENAMLLDWTSPRLITWEDKTLREEGHYADAAFFQAFTFPLLVGDPATVLKAPESIVISESLASSLFGPDWRTQDNLLGQILRLDHEKDFRITGVFEDVPVNSTIQFDYVLPMEAYLQQNEWVENWSNAGLQLFVRLKPGTDHEEVNRKIENLIRDNKGFANATPFLHPLTDIRLHSEFRDGKQVGGRITYVRLFTLVAIFILVIACINFMNLATARSTQRAKEIGVRKVVGATQPSLIGQFLGESMLMALVAFVLASLLVVGLLPAFNELTGESMALSDLDPGFACMMLGIALLTGIVSGGYPALYLSSFNPVSALRGTFRQRPLAGQLRKGLVVFQFVLSTLLIAGTFAIYAQVQYIRSKSLGLDRSNLVYVALEGAVRDQYDAFRQELMARPGIENVTTSSQNPLDVGNNTTDPTWEGKDPEDGTLFYIINANYEFVETMKMELVAGRTFSRAFATDSVNFIINERAAQAMGMDDPIGQALSMWDRDGQIVGVVKDFHMNSLYEAIEPTIIRLDPPATELLFARTEPGKTQEALASLEAVMAQFNPGYPFEYEFLDKEYEEMYRSEVVMGRLANAFAFVAIFISCLGLFGLASFTAEQRRKEIGVRKVLGASAAGLVVLLSRDVTRLVVLAFIISAPVAYYAINRWLNTFEYHVTFPYEMFGVAGISALLIAWLTVSYQAIKAAVADPVKSLRYE